MQREISLVTESNIWKIVPFTGEMEGEIGRNMSKEKVGVRVSEEILGLLSSAVVVTISDISRGWKWVLQAIGYVFHFHKLYEFRIWGS